MTRGRLSCGRSLTKRAEGWIYPEKKLSIETEPAGGTALSQPTQRRLTNRASLSQTQRSLGSPRINRSTAVIAAFADRPADAAVYATSGDVAYSDDHSRQTSAASRQTGGLAGRRGRYGASVIPPALAELADQALGIAAVR